MTRTRLVPTAFALALLAAGALAPAATGGGRCGDQPCRADMSVSGHAEPQPIRKGQKTELKVTPKNDGPDGALAVDLQVDVHRKLKILGTRVFGGFGCDVQGTFVQCDMGDFARDQLGVVRIKVKGKKKGTFVSNARVYASDIIDSNGGNDRVGITVGVQGKGR
jgi:Domain of unknown function DUF11